MESFPAIKSTKIHRSALWILGEYADNSKEVIDILDVIYQSLGDVPIVEAEQKKLNGEIEKETDGNNTTNVTGQSMTNNKITSDGTYATQSAFSVAV